MEVNQRKQIQNKEITYRSLTVNLAFLKEKLAFFAHQKKGRIYEARVNSPDTRPQPQVPERRPMPFFSPRYALSKMGKKKKIHPDPKEKVAKVATKNRQNRHLAEFRQAI